MNLHVIVLVLHIYKLMNCLLPLVFCPVMSFPSTTLKSCHLLCSYYTHYPFSKKNFFFNHTFMTINNTWSHKNTFNILLCPCHEITVICMAWTHTQCTCILVATNLWFIKHCMYHLNIMDSIVTRLQMCTRAHNTFIILGYKIHVGSDVHSIIMQLFLYNCVRKCEN